MKIVVRVSIVPKSNEGKNEIIKEGKKDLSE